MSEVTKFLEKVEGDASLNEKFAALETNEEIIAFAGEQGFTFTEEEYEKALEEKLNLGDVAGGAALRTGFTRCPYSAPVKGG